MIYVDEIKVTPNPVDAGKTFKIEVSLHEEYENGKKYGYRYGYRYGEKKERKNETIDF